MAATQPWHAGFSATHVYVVHSAGSPGCWHSDRKDPPQGDAPRGYSLQSVASLKGEDQTRVPFVWGFQDKFVGLWSTA